MYLNNEQFALNITQFKINLAQSNNNFTIFEFNNQQSYFYKQFKD